jgi:predicted transcriptional regulator
LAENSQRIAEQDTEIMLEVLSAVERDSRITQRSLSRELGIALGLANAYLKRCAKKGLIKIQQVPLNRYAYYITPKGFAEKSRLTAKYLAISFNFFRDAREQCTGLFEQSAARGIRTLALAGDGDLAEIAVLSATDTQVRIACVIDGASANASCAGRPVVSDLKAAQALAADGLDAIVITDVRAPQVTYEEICEAAGANGLPVQNVLAPAVLRITGQPKSAERGSPV